ncbi:MAG: hypothetical protein ABIP17_12100 [Ilumatobacteraceae bacterium]
MSDAPPPTSPDLRRRPKPATNFAARRMLVSTVAITAIIAFAVLAWTALRDDDGGAFGGLSNWKEIAIVDRRSGDVVVLDAEGHPDHTLIGLGPVDETHVVGNRLALVGSSQIVITGGDGEATTTAIDRTSSITPIRTDDGLFLVVGRPAGGDVRIVDVRTGDLLDIGALAGQTDPFLFAETIRWAADGSAFAVGDAASFQTIVVRPGVDEASFFPSQPVAVSNDRVATSQIVDRQADIGLFDYERDSKARVPTEIPAGGVMDGDDLIVVSTAGTISRVTGGASEAERVGAVTVPSGGTVISVDPTADGERLVVTGDVFQAVIDLEGTTIFSTTFTSPITVRRPDPSWSCLPVGGDGSFHSLVVVETGEQIADLSGVEVTGASSDGCTVIGERAGITEVIGADGSVDIGRAKSATLGPDGRTVVRTGTAGDTELLRIDDELALTDPVDITAWVTPNAIVTFLD